ncbi:hypothetical protein LLB57_002129 [Escherichia coli]|nr:hypothetical protein [Escherichia coli]
MAARRQKVFGIEFRNATVAIVQGNPTWDRCTGVATVPVRICHSEIVDETRAETVIVSWECSEQEASDPVMRTGARLLLRDDTYAPFPPVRDVLAGSDKVSLGYANFLQAVGTAIEVYTRKHFPQGLNTPGVPGYRRKPYRPRRKTNEVNITLMYDAFRRSKRDVVIDLTPADEATII